MDDASTDGEQDVLNKYFFDNFDTADSSVYRNEDNVDYHLLFARHKTNKNCYFAVLNLKYNHYGKKNITPYISEWIDNSKYIALCEGDDYWVQSEKLQKQVNILEQRPEITYICTRYNVLNSETGEMRLASNYYFDDKSNENVDCFVFSRDDAFSHEWFTKTPTCIYRSECEDETFLSQFRYRRDVHRVYCILSKGSGICMSCVSAVYRLNPNSTFGGKSLIERLKQNYQVYEELYLITKDPIFRNYLMNTYQYLFRHQVKSYRIPRTRLQFYALFVYVPKLLYTKLKINK
jgi:hypothetical protein